MRPPSLHVCAPLLLLALSLSQTPEAAVAMDDCRLSSLDKEGGAEEGANRVVAGEAPGMWIWQAHPGEELRCDADGFEPVDLWCGEGCGGEVQVLLQPARSVEVAPSDVADELTVEWRRLGPPGESTQLLATRTIRLQNGQAQIPVASGDDRVLRLKARISAPQTIFVPQDDGAPWPELRVAETEAGGEVFGFLESAAEEPALLYLQGVTTPSFRATLTLGAFGEFSLRGLAEGAYRPRAVYPGGAASVGPDIEVAAGETAELIPWRVEKPAVSEPVLAREEPKDDAVATLLGRVTIADDEPASDLLVEARTAGPGDRVEEADEPDEPRPTARTDAAGRFELALPEAGWWQLRFAMPSGFPVREQDVELMEGVNAQDFDLGNAAIRVRIVRGDGEPLTEAVHIELKRGRGGDVVRSGVLPAGEGGGDVAELLLLDLTFGSYQVSAYTESGWASRQPARALPNKNSPIGSAELVLQQQSDRIAVVRMPDGSPATDVLVALDRRQVFPGRPGEFPLTGANELSQIRVMPDLDYLPVCRKVGDLERLEIDLQPATAEAVLVPSRDRMPPTGRYLGILEGLPGSDCPMPIALQWQPFRDERGRDRILLRGLVPGVYTLNPLRGEPREMVVPGPPVPLAADAQSGKE